MNLLGGTLGFGFISTPYGSPDLPFAVLESHHRVVYHFFPFFLAIVGRTETYFNLCEPAVVVRTVVGSEAVGFCFLGNF